MALVSIITPVFNGERYLAECIQSVLAQSFDDWEYVILDNCSTDRTRCIAEEYASRDERIRVYHNDTCLPMIANFNRAATLASVAARYLKFLCADDLLFPECLTQMVAIAEANPDVVLVGSYKVCGREAVCEGPPFYDEVVDGRSICKQFFYGRLGLLGSQTNHLIRSRLSVGRVELFDESFIHADIELWVRLLKDGSRFGFVHQVLTFTRIHDEAASEYSHLVGSGDVEFLALLMRHGDCFLSKRERRFLLRQYRRKLARFRVRVFANAWDRRPWKYQVARSRELGIHFGVFDIVQAAFLEVLIGALAPMKATRRVQRFYRRGTSGKRTQD